MATQLASASNDHGNLLADTAVRSLGGGRFVGEIPPRWMIAMTHGGSAMAAALQVLRAVVAPDRALVSASASFLRGLPAGPFDARAEILRETRSGTFAQSDIATGEGELALRVVGLHAAPPSGQPRQVPTRAFPCDARPLDEAGGLPLPTSGPFGEIMAGLPFIGQQERRLALGTPPDDPSFTPREPRIAVWTRFHVTPWAADGTLDPIAYPCLGDDNMAYLQRTGPEGLARRMISLQLDLQCFATTRSDWVLQHGIARHADDRYLLSEVEIWDPNGTLLAIVTQRALLK